jgi:hypothetical protein
MATLNDRDYIVGSTVKLLVGTRDPATRSPLDPPTPPVLDHLSRGGTAVTLPGTTTFTLITPGFYELSLQTTGYTPGVYVWRARATDANGDVALSEDQFVLRAPA